MKRGSMELSINAIVILIMAIAMLGVGIYFINTVLKGKLQESLTTSDTIQQLINREIQKNDLKLFIYGLGNDGLTINQGQSKQVDIGIGNREQELKVYVARVIKEDDPNSIVTIKYSQTPKPINVGQIETVPASFKAGTTRGQAIYKVNIYDLGADKTETNIGDTNGQLTTCTESDTSKCDTLYASQTFFVTVQ